ncbi:MAG: hypothetical protein LAT67_14640 [Balneolales bacterium]|nr:hypothetical protein [Balneolales bacterium]
MKKTTTAKWLPVLILIFISLMTTELFAQNMEVSGAGSANANGTYIETGTSEGKPRYVKDGDPSWEIIWQWGIRWVIAEYGMENYEAWENVATPNLVTTWDVSMGFSPAPTVTQAGRAVSFSTQMFVENQDINDGSIGNSITITHNENDDDYFAGSFGEDFLLNGKAEITNVPAGLSATLVWQSASELLFSFSGTALSHTNANDITNLTLEFSDTAFDQGDAQGVTNFSITDLEVNFIEVVTVASSGGDFTSIQAAVDAIVEYDVIELSAETYTVTSTIQINKSLLLRGQGVGLTIIQGNTEVTSSGTAHALFAASGWDSSNIDNVRFHDMTFRYGFFNSGGMTSIRMSGVGYFELVRAHIYGNRGIHTNAAGLGLAMSGTKNALIKDSLFEDNAITNAGPYSGGSSIWIDSGHAKIINTTFYNNSVVRHPETVGWETNGGTVLVTGSLSEVNIINSTFTANEGHFGGAVSTGENPVANITNSILFGNTASNGGDDLYRRDGTINAYNSIIGVSAANSGTPINGISSNVTSADPLLSPEGLADNEGPTMTIALQPGSPAIDAGLENEFVPETDQR